MSAYPSPDTGPPSAADVLKALRLAERLLLRANRLSAYLQLRRAQLDGRLVFTDRLRRIEPRPPPTERPE